MKFDATWTGTAESFIIHWRQQALHLNKLKPASEKFPDNALMVMLQTSVRGVPDLCQVQTNCSLNRAANGKTINYETYSDLLLAAAVLFDKNNQPIKANRR